jgi:hypothetical protein
LASHQLFAWAGLEPQSSQSHHQIRLICWDVVLLGLGFKPCSFQSPSAR